MGKRGSLSLSINAIVVLILAITMLGLGLGFMRSSFGGVTEQFGQVTDEMKQQMIERMKDNVDDAMLNAYEINMKPSDERFLYLAIKNTDDTTGGVNFQLVPTGTDPVVDTSGNGVTTITIEFFQDMLVGPSSIDVFPLKVTTTGAASGTYKASYTLQDDSGSDIKQLQFYIIVSA